MGISSGRIWPIGWQVDGSWSGLISNVAGELKVADRTKYGDQLILR